VKERFDKLVTKFDRLTLGLLLSALGIIGAMIAKTVF